MNHSFTDTGDLVLKLDQDDDPSDFIDAIEPLLANGWEWILPEEIGAMTDSPIISPDASREDDGTLRITESDRVFYHPNYMIEDELEAMRSPAGLTLTLAR